MSPRATRFASSALLSLLLLAAPFRAAEAASGGSEDAAAEEIARLRAQLAVQQKQVDELQVALQAQQRLLDGLAQRSAAASAVPVSAPSPAAAAPVVAAVRPAGAAPAAGKSGETQPPGGFQFSGDFRYRLDVQARSGNEFAGPLQNVRSRYRVRLNVDKEIDPRFRFHLQLSTGPANNGITNDQDMAATVAKPAFSIAEAWVDFHPNSTVSLRGGRMEEVFADNMRFLWDDDVRFNGFQQILRLRPASKSLGVSEVEFRSGEYILTNPNVAILSAASPFVTAGYQPGQKVRSSNLFHPGFLARGDINQLWSHQFAGGMQLYRNPTQIQLASLASGYPVLVSNGLGFALALPMTGTGNATTAPGGAIYTARAFQIVHAGYRLERKGLKLAGRDLPVWLDLQASRNTGAGRLRDAVMASINAGAVKRLGDVRFLYQFAIKDANALISQFTDDDLGTGSGVNIAVHAVRFDLGLARHLQWQNLLFVQNARRGSEPAYRFFVPLPRGANPTFRYLGQLAFTF